MVGKKVSEYDQEKPQSHTVDQPTAPGCVWGEGTLIFSHIRRLGSFFGLKILIFNIFLAFRKLIFLGGMTILWIFLGGRDKIGLVLGVISMYFRVFS